MDNNIELPEKLHVFYLCEGDIPECVELAARNFEELENSPEQIKTWFENRIVHNPWQQSLPGYGVGIRVDNKLIAFRAVFAQPWWINGATTTIAFASNTVVDPAYRGKGLASIMIEENKKFADLSGSTSAGIITQKAYKKLGFFPIGGNDNGFFRLRASYKNSFQKRLGARWGGRLGKMFDTALLLRDNKYKPTEQFYLAQQSRCGHEFDALWEKAKSYYPSCLEHSSQYLNWRLFDYPTFPLYLSALKDSADKLRAYGVWHINTFSGSVKMAVLRDAFYDPSDESAIEGLLYHLIGHWRREGIDRISLEVASSFLTPLFTRLKYEHVPSRGNRYHIFSKTPIETTILNHWYRSGLDGDYFDLPTS